MSLNILDLIKGQLGPALVSQAASHLGESESSISKAISGLLPAVVGGLANNANNPAVVDAVSNAHNSGLLSNLLGSATNNSLITTVINSIFGDKLSGVINAVSSFAGINNSSAGSLLNLVTGATLGTVGKYATDNNLGASGISKLLADQKGIVSTLLPAGLSLATLGLGHFGSTNSTVHTDAPRAAATPKVEVNRGGNTHVTPEPENNGSSILKWLLPLLLLGVLGWFLWNRCSKKPETVATTTTDSTAVVDNTATKVDSTKTTTTAVVTKTDEDIDLNGTKLKGYKGGLEERMITFLKSGEYDKATEDGLKNTWYDFDHVNFKMGSANQLEAGSEGQIQNLIAILKQFPTAKIKIGGYTDNTGDKAANKKLSQERADFIKSELTKGGVGAQVTGAEGYGSEHATVPATASDAERAIDRKMSVRFSK